jgi:pimeloyl-ACP methyl ester carboxylesterase
LIEAGVPTEDMIPKIREANPHEPVFFPAWKAECLQQMDVEVLRNVVEGKPSGGGDPLENLNRISCPILLAQADPDNGGILPDEYLASITPKRADLTVKKIIGASHNINREYPELFLPVGLPWLERFA